MKNAIVRQISLEFLLRRMQQYSRGVISLGHMKSTARLCSNTLKHSNTKNQKVCLTTLSIFLPSNINLFRTPSWRSQRKCSRTHPNKKNE